MIEQNNNVASALPLFIEYPEIPFLDEDKGILNKEVYIFEKIDGAQSQVRNTLLGVYGGSRSSYLTGRKYDASWFGKFNSWMRKNKSLTNLPQNIIVFGEWLDPTTIEYKPQNLHKFYFLDLAAIDSGKPVFYDFKEALDYLQKWGIENIEILGPIKRGRFSSPEIEELRANTKSQLYDGKLEGLVLKNYPTLTFAKTLNPEYSDLREQEKTLEDKYINAPRVKKAVRRLRDERGVAHPGFSDVVEEVQKDVVKESGIRFDYRAIAAVVRIRRYYPYQTASDSGKINLPDAKRESSWLKARQETILTRVTRRLVKTTQKELGDCNPQKLALEVGKKVFPNEDFDTEEIISIMRRLKLI
jgi:hypothetical protein